VLVVVTCCVLLILTHQRFASAEHCSCVSQLLFNSRYERVRGTKHAPPGPFRLLQRRHGLAEIVERGAVISVNRHRVTQPHLEREVMTLPENASRHRYSFAQQRLDFFEAPYAPSAQPTTLWDPSPAPTAPSCDSESEELPF